VSWYGLLRPAYSLRAHVRPEAYQALAAALAKAPGRIVLTPEEIDPATELRCITIDTDGPVTQQHLRTLLHDRLGADLIHLADPAMSAAATGKTTQRICVPTSGARDLALLDSDADHRVISHLLLNPDDVDACTGRGQRVALVSNASAVHDLGPLPAAAVLPALESTAVHLRRATGLDIHPLPLAADTPQALAAAAAALAPGFAALCLTHVHPAHALAVRAALGEGSTPAVDAVAHAHTVATTAATLNALRRKGIDIAESVVVLAGAHGNGDLVTLLHAAGIGELTLYDAAPPLVHDLTGTADLVVDLIGLPAPADGTPVLRACPQDPPPLHVTESRPHPLHALPALLTAAARGRRIDDHGLLAAARTLADLAEIDSLLPPVDQPGLPQALAAAFAPATPSGF